MDREQLKKVLPHREPMLLLDEAEVVDGVACGRYHVTGEEFFVQGHFPGNPVVPRVTPLRDAGPDPAACRRARARPRGATPYYTSLDKVRFKHPVAPGRHRRAALRDRPSRRARSASRERHGLGRRDRPA